MNLLSHVHKFIYKKIWIYFFANNVNIIYINHGQFCSKNGLEHSDKSLSRVRKVKNQFLNVHKIR